MAVIASASIIAFIVSQSRTQQQPFRFSYLRRHKAKSKKLKDLMEELSIRANDIKRRFDLGEEQTKPGKKPNDDIRLWLEHVVNIQRECYKLAGEVGEEKKYFKGRVPNYRSRLKLGKRMDTKTKEAIVLLGEARFLDDSSSEMYQEKRKRDYPIEHN